MEVAVLALAAPALAGCLGAAVVDELEVAGLGGFSRTSVFPGVYRTEGVSRFLREGPLDVLPSEVVALASALDGEPIQIGLLRPAVPEGARVPVIAWAWPYFQHLTQPVIDEMREDLWFMGDFVPHGYALAFIAARGSAGSGGCIDFFGPAERADLDQAVTWLGEQPWSTGAVGMVGFSYGGTTPWEVAGLGNPHLKTIVPLAGITNLYGWAVRNGTPVHQAPQLFADFYTGISLGLWGTDRPAPRVAASAACPQVLEALGAVAASSWTGERDPLGYMAERDLRPGVEENYRGSVFLVHGFVDAIVPAHLAYPWVGELERRGVVVKHLAGPWDHVTPDMAPLGDAAARRWDFAEILLHWFDYWLKGDTAVDLGPRVQVADSAGAWRDEDAWPPSDAVPRTFFLGPRGLLLDEPSGDTGTEVLVPDPRRAVLDLGWTSQRFGDVGGTYADFATGPFAREFRLAGLPQAHITVTPTGPGGHVTAFLWAASEDWSWSRLLGQGRMDLRFADGGDEAKPVVPGEKLLLRMELDPLDAVVPAGTRLVFGLSQRGQGNADFYNRGPVPTYPVRIEVGQEQSTFTVLTFERGAGAFFDPPGAEAP